MKTLTVFTPTYNRAYCLYQCYESLCRQTSNDFLWMIIDDGSSDSTRELVDSWIAEGKIDIEYYYKENGGMHSAHNEAYAHIETELNVCIDSDDYMTDNAVELIVTRWRRDGSDQYAGIVGLDAYKDGQIIGTEFPSQLKSSTLMHFYQLGGKGDKKIVYRTDVIRSVPDYPEFQGEKFVPLGYKYLLCDLKYELLLLNEPLCVVEYMQDGSSRNIILQYFRHPQGFAFSRKAIMMYHSSFKRRFQAAIHYISSSIISKNNRFLIDSPCKGLTLLAITPGIIFHCYLVIQRRKLISNK